MNEMFVENRDFSCLLARVGDKMHDVIVARIVWHRIIDYTQGITTMTAAARRNGIKYTY